MKGRPISLEEFERMLRAVPRAGGQADHRLDLRHRRRVAVLPAWLWLSGLRLTESLELRWDEAPGALVADFTGRRPMLRIPAESEKGNTHRLLLMAPEFSELLDSVPIERRRSQVFRFPVDCPRTPHSVCQRVVAIGKAAGIVVKQRQKLDDKGKLATVNQCASDHDLRRSFGFRWSRKVMPTVLRELMRHESIETTMRYYVGQNAESTADTLWECHKRESQPAELGTTSGTIG
jgi:integrase